MRVILSIFCNSERYIDRYFEQIECLEQQPFLILLEGNSTDRTYELLQEKLKGYRHILCQYNVPLVFGSEENSQRFLQLSRLWNFLIDQIPIEAEKVAFIESDLLWSAETLDFLFELTDTYKFVCPQVIKLNFFYDTWGYRYEKNKRFDSDIYQLPNQIIPIYSAGSCLVMKAELTKARLKKENAFIGFCENVKEELFCIPIYVYHD